MEFRAIIIDDEQKGIDSLSILIEKYLQDVRIVASSTSALSAAQLIHDYRPEIVFLDINMPEMNGFELLSNLAWRDFHLVFTTAHSEHGLKALRSNAVDYLLKPIDHNDLSEALTRIKTRINTHENEKKFNIVSTINSTLKVKNRLLINLRAELHSVPIDEIIYLESVSNYTKIYLQDSNDILTSRTLGDFDNELCTDENGFMRVHHSFIVNLKKVSRYLKSTETLVMNNSHEISVSRSRKEAFYHWLNL